MSSWSYNYDPFFRCTLDLLPVPKGRPKFTRSGHCYTPAKTKDFEKKVQLISKSAMKGKTKSTKALYAVVNFYLQMPKRPKSKYPITRPDGDNLTKAIYDALNQIVWEDDSQIVSWMGSKRYAQPGTKPRIEISIHELIE